MEPVTVMNNSIDATRGTALPIIHKNSLHYHFSDLNPALLGHTVFVP